MDATSKKLLAQRGTKAVYEVEGGSGREYITVLRCGSADGVKLPPFVVHKGKNFWARWTEGGPTGQDGPKVVLQDKMDQRWPYRGHL